MLQMLQTLLQETFGLPFGERFKFLASGEVNESHKALYPITGLLLPDFGVYIAEGVHISSDFLLHVLWMNQITAYICLNMH